jgi:hypothetical protein
MDKFSYLSDIIDNSRNFKNAVSLVIGSWFNKIYYGGWWSGSSARAPA